MGPEIPDRGSKTPTVPIVWVNFGIFFGAIQTISCHDWLSWTKPGYITMTRRQSNKKWSCGIAVHHVPKIPSAKISWKFLASIFWDQAIIFQRAKLSTRSINHLCWCNWRTFWRKNTTVISPRRSCSCMTMPRFTGQLQPRRNWPICASSILITHHILRI